MGLSPRDVDVMSLAAWVAVCDGWNRAHSKDGNAKRGDPAEEPPAADWLEVKEWLLNGRS